MSKLSKSARDNRANQLNPEHPVFHQSRGASPDEAERMAAGSKPVLDNRASERHPSDVDDAASGGESKSSSSSSNLSPAKPE
jgi:hypothetical protein